MNEPSTRPGTSGRTAVTARPALPTTTSRRGLLVGLALGLPVVAYGIRGALVDGADTHPGELARWVIGAAVVHDVLVVPVTLAAAWVVRRIVPSVAWPAVRAGLLTTGVLGLVAWPLVRGYGRNPTVPSLLPRDYGSGLAVALGIVWLVVGLAALVAWWRRARTRWPGGGPRRPVADRRSRPTTTSAASSSTASQPRGWARRIS